MTIASPQSEASRKAILRPRLHVIYFVLATFDLLAVCSSLYLIDRITGIHTRAVEVNQTWARRMDDYGALMRMAAAVNAPGNDVFDSGDVDAEARRLQESYAAFHARADELRDELARAGVPATLLAQFDTVNTSMSRMVEEARQIFERFRRQDLVEAGAHMAAMDRQYLQVTNELNELGVRVRELQSANTTQQMAAAASWRTIEWILAGFIVVMVLAVTMYGFALARRMRHSAEELARHREHLEEMVERRTAQLEKTHEQLRQSDRLASIGTLAAGLGHDMNNVLLPVRGHLNALTASADGRSGDREHLDRIHRGVAYLQQLADGLHYLAMNPDEHHKDHGVTDLHAWWEQTGALLSKAVPKYVEVTTSIKQGLPNVAVAPHALTQAVLNLIVNSGEAIASSPTPRQGCVRLIAERATDGASVRLSVSDNGAGMTDEVKRRAFDMFYTTKPRGLGTGLGLAMVRKVADRSGGTIELESAQGEGTTITLVLPAASGENLRRQRVAAIRLRDGRAASLIRSLLEASGVEIDDHGDSKRADIWVVDPTPALLDETRTWLRKQPRGRVVLLGRPEPGAAGACDGLEPVTIDDPADLDAVRDAMSEVMSQHQSGNPLFASHPPTLHESSVVRPKSR